MPEKKEVEVAEATVDDALSDDITPVEEPPSVDATTDAGKADEGENEPISERGVWLQEVEANAAERAKAEKAAKTAAAKPKKPKKRRKPAWRETRWAGHPNYQCIYCHYSTFDLEAMAQHADAHTEEEA